MPDAQSSGSPFLLREWWVLSSRSLCGFHHAVQDDRDQVDAAIARLREHTSADDHAYFVDIAQFMADLPADQGSGVRWLDGEQDTRRRWRGLVLARQTHLHAGS